MSDFKQVSDALAEGAEPEMLCMTCPWDRFCITPPSMTKGDVDAAIEKAKAEDARLSEEARAEGREAGMPVGLLLSAITLSGRDTSCTVCPVFALRLRSAAGGQLVQEIRARMQRPTETPS